MAGPFTQVEIQAEIDFYKAQMRLAATNQEHTYGGPAGSFGFKKGDLEKVQSALQYWVDMMNEFYPDAYAVQPQIEFNEIGFVNG